MNTNNNSQQSPTFYRSVILLVCLMFQTMAFAQPTQSELSAEADVIENKLEDIEAKIQKQEYSEDDLQQFNKQLSIIKIDIAGRIIEIETDTKHLDDQIKTLGEAIPDEPQDVKDKRNTLQKIKSANEKALAHLRVLDLKNNELLAKTKNLQKELLAQRLLSKGPTIAKLISLNVANPSQYMQVLSDYIDEHHGFDEIALDQYIFIFLILAVSLLLGYWIKYRVIRWLPTKISGTGFISTLIQTITVTSARFAPLFFLSVALALAAYEFYETLEVTSLINVITDGLPFWVIACFLIYLFFKPKLPARVFLRIPENVANNIGRMLLTLATFWYLGYILIRILYVQDAPKPLLLFSRDVFALVTVGLLTGVVIYGKKIPQYSHKVLPRVVLIIVLVSLLSIELLGYRNLVAAIFKISSGILGAFVFIYLLHRVTREFFDALDFGVRDWHKALRTKLGLAAEQHVPGLMAMRFVTFVFLWGGFVLLSLKLFGISDTLFQQTRKLLTHGITLGTLNINPSRILLAIVVFSMLYAVSSWIKTQLDRHWLSKSRIERGAREALVTISGYVGTGIAALIALGIAGVTFTNIAIIAGALSVGIGFGLQTIVNNFVSGLILLFERPIKKGDWVVVGSTEGYVKKISIRSTQIQTFDRADIIVPNSDLISNQVTNWMLHDKSGRIRVPIGVAYGSDTEKVRQLLFDVAGNHAKVIKDDPKRRIKVFFLNFGDSSLNFELRCHVQDIDEALSIKSDLNFAIDKVFRENGIEIPFPQRDVHIRQASESVQLSEK